MNNKLRKFVDPLIIPSKAKPIHKAQRNHQYEISIEEFKHKMHQDLPPTKVWGYNYQFPGPVFDVDRGEAIQVEWINNLPIKHFLPVDKTVHNLKDLPEVRTVTHLHGSITESSSDGYPEAWYTKDYKEVGPEFKQRIYNYPNIQQATTLWYHDHAMGITRLNVYAGLVGMYIIRDRHEKSLHLPKDAYEIPLILMDRSFNDDGSLYYPLQPDNTADNLPTPSIRPFFLGETNVVNGKVWPYMDVEPRKYRFRILNAANTRAYQLYFNSGLDFHQIGSDGGLLKHTVTLNTLAIEPAERMDIVIDFSHSEGKTLTLKNDLGPNADPEDETNEVMQFRVRLPLKGEDTSSIDKQLSSIPSLKKNKITKQRFLKLGGTTDKFGRPLLLLDNKFWKDAITETPALGTTEVWSFTNTTAFTHPIHLHLIQFQVINRQTFDLDLYNQDGSILFTGPPKPPKRNERGWKDTIAAHSGEVTRVIVEFGPFTGDYVWHCHILEHEDYDMMRPMKVINPKDKDH